MEYIYLCGMKKTLSLSLVVICSFIWAFLCLTSCEKHDGISYYHSKCEAELNGQYLIDQSRFDWGLGVGKTPYLMASEYEAEFESKLSVERGVMPLYYVNIRLFVDKPFDFLTEPQSIKLENIDGIDEAQSTWDYKQYCDYNKINYATIFNSANTKTEIVKDGSFEITEFDKDKRTYKGKFKLQFSEGTLKGEFSIY